MHEYAEVSFFITTKNSRSSHESLYILRINRTTVSCSGSFPETLPEDDEQLMPNISATESDNKNVFIIHYLPYFHASVLTLLYLPFLFRWCSSVRMSIVLFLETKPNRYAYYVV